MPWMACIPLMQEQLTVCEVWNWLQEKRFARNVPQAEGAWSVFGYFLLTKKYQWPAFGWVLVFAFVFGFDLKKESGKRWETYKSLW